MRGRDGVALKTRKAAGTIAVNLAIPADRGPNSGATRRPESRIRGMTVVGPLLFQRRHWARCRRCGPPPTRRSRGGQYYGPSHLAEQRDYPGLVQSSAASHDERLQRWLWAVSEQSTGVTYPV